MTEKQENIINAALQLFSEEGYQSTSTSSVAKKAGVSEGLIFRHFKNKEGLLEVIIHQGENQLKELISDILIEKQPKETIRKALNIITTIKLNEKALAFWKLQFKLKWELEIYDKGKSDDLNNKLIEAFKELRYKNPEQEASLLLINIDGLGTQVLLNRSFELKPMLEFLLNKYGL